MINADLLNNIAQALSDKLNEKIEFEMTASVGGGSINQTYQLKTETKSYFLKVNSATQFPKMFQREAEGLKALKLCNAILVAEPLLYGDFEDQSWLLMNFIDSGQKGSSFWKDFGKQLSDLHRNSKEKFGFENDNFIGSLPQSNQWMTTWSEFFIEQRLEPLVKLARDEDKIDSGMASSFDKLYRMLEGFFPEEVPALIHGDLWSGNFMSTATGDPIIFDPAVYYGHREMDIGMSKLFGGFELDFYHAYNEFFPLEKGWQERLQMANLYPLMVHVNLFGGSYLQDVRGILRKLV